MRKFCGNSGTKPLMSPHLNRRYMVKCTTFPAFQWYHSHRLNKVIWDLNSSITPERKPLRERNPHCALHSRISTSFEVNLGVLNISWFTDKVSAESNQWNHVNRLANSPYSPFYLSPMTAIDSGHMKQFQWVHYHQNTYLHVWCHYITFR